ncbi:hypothetical protein GF357_02815 [Candidatus Dojkabacteria bacterium]|nr:hypothetical protein [Candidatus Dojkabacteria bacterium]
MIDVSEIKNLMIKKQATPVFVVLRKTLILQEIFFIVELFETVKNGGDSGSILEHLERLKMWKFLLLDPK